MKLLVDLFVIKNGFPSVDSRKVKLKRGDVFSITQPGFKDASVPPFKIIMIGFFKFRIEVKSDNYVKFELKKNKSK